MGIRFSFISRLNLTKGYSPCYPFAQPPASSVAFPLVMLSSTDIQYTCSLVLACAVPSAWDALSPFSSASLGLLLQYLSYLSWCDMQY